ncbi:MAG: hypothetical protein ABIK86_07495 [candidate division WOR-3 bacterium]
MRHVEYRDDTTVMVVCTRKDGSVRTRVTVKPREYTVEEFDGNRQRNYQRILQVDDALVRWESEYNGESNSGESFPPSEVLPENVWTEATQPGSDASEVLSLLGFYEEEEQ